MRATGPLLACLAVSACETARAPERPNVLLVTLDTLRADRLGAYGYAGAETPNLDRLAREGARFETAIAQTPLTLPSHSSLFTGAYPTRHGVRDNGQVLTPDLPTLAELARARGYETAAFVSAFVLDAKWGLDRGFDTYVDAFDLSRFERVSLGGVERPAGETIGSFLDWLEAGRDDPFFAWIHLYDPHAPYEPPEPYRSRFETRPYDGEIAYLDAAFGGVLEALRRRDELDETVIVVVGDHGEGLGEHGELTHGNFVYDATMHVPLLMRGPGVRPGLVVEEVVALLDLFPTLVAVVGAPPASDSAGTNLLPLLKGDVGGELSERAIFVESYYPRLHYGWSEVVGVRTRGAKFIDTPDPELFDLTADPAESRNLASEQGDRVEAMRSLVLEHFSEGTLPQSQAALDAETESRLRALGYVGGAAAAPEVPRRELPDPKDKIDLVRAISRADALGAAGELEEAVALLEDVLRGDPEIVDAYVSLGNKLSSMGETDRAIAAFERCLELRPDYDLALVNLALAYKLGDRLTEARAAFERVLASDPSNRQAHFNLGEIAMTEERYEAALAHFDEGLALEPGSPVFLRQAGMASYYQGDLAASLERLTEAARAQDDLEMVHYMRALVFEKLGDAAQAESAYREELSHHPENFRAAINLAGLYARQSRTMEQIGVLEELTERHPTLALGFYQLSKAYRDAGLEELYPKALAAAARALELDPDSDQAPLAFYVQAELLQKMGRPDEAREAFERGRALQGRRED